MSAIRFEQVSKSFDNQPVLHNLDLEVEEAETKIILGGTGSGKTTILKMVLGLVRPDSGRIFVGEEDITELDETEMMPIRKKIGMVFQEGALFDSLTVGENVAFQMREEGSLARSEIAETVFTLLGFVGLQDVIDKFPSQLSGGMRRRVGIARALVGDPRILLYDSPTAGLDPITGRTICELVMMLRDLQGVASIFVTHDLKSAMTLASEFVEKRTDGELVFLTEDEGSRMISTRFVMLREGRVFFEGTVDALRNIDDAYVQEFLT